MKQVQPDVWETDMQSPFPGLKTHAYLHTRDDGNLLFYNTGHEYEIQRFAELGGVSRQYLSHEDELGESLNSIAERYQSLLLGHEREAKAFAKVRKPDLTFNHSELHLDNVLVIPTPGHSPGSTCFMVSSPTGKKYLFTGDTIFLDESNQWRAGFIASVHTEQNRRDLANSLALLATLEPDVVFGSAYTGEHGYQTITNNSWSDKVHQALAQLLKGHERHA